MLTSFSCTEDDFVVKSDDYLQKRTHIYKLVYGDSTASIDRGDKKSRNYLADFVRKDTIDGDLTIPKSIEIDGVVYPVTEIERRAFGYYGSLKNVNISSSIVAIDQNAFYGSLNENIMVDSENPVFSSEDGVLYNKDKTVLMRYPYGKKGKYIIPNSVDTISDKSLWHCPYLTEAVISDSLIVIGEDVFSYCFNLKNINIPSGVVAIDRSAFIGCSSLTSIDVDTSNLFYTSENGVLYNKDKTILVRCPEGKGGVLSISKGVNTVDLGAFGHYSNLTGIEVDLENPIYSSKDGVLYNKDKTILIKCPQKKQGKVQIPNTVTNIEARAFDGCANLTNIVISSSVVDLGGFTFEGCTALDTIFIEAQVPPTTDYGVFSGVKAKIKISPTSKSAYDPDGDRKWKGLYLVY